MIVHLEEIDRVIGQLFSPELAADGEVARAVAVPMRRWVPRQVSLEELSESLQDALFGALSRQTGGSMWYRRGEEMRRITTASLAQAGRHLAATALPLALICTGAAFDFRSLFHMRDFSLWTSLLRVTVAPALTVVLGLAFGLDKVPFGVLFLMSCSPIAAAAYVMTKAMGGNDRAAANIIGITTVLSMVCAPLWITLMRWGGLM